jgi:hypothetical protein
VGVARHADPATRRPGDRLVGVGAVVFVVGLVAVVGCLVLFLGGSDVPLALVLLASTLPVGLGLALAGLVRSALSGPRPQA